MSSSTNQPYSHNVFLDDDDNTLTTITNDINFLNNNAFLVDSSKPLTELAVGPTPPVAKLSLYAKLDNNLYIKNSLGVETLISGGGGGGSVPLGTNYSNYLYWDDTTLDYEVGDTQIKLGKNCGKTGQGVNAVAMGVNAGSSGQFGAAIAIGLNTGTTNQGAEAIAIGTEAGKSGQGSNSIAIGTLAGSSGQLANAIAIGDSCGEITQGVNAIAIGDFAGNSGQLARAIAIGINSGKTTQGTEAIAIGSQAGIASQGANSIAIGLNAGNTGQLTNSVAIGNNSGSTIQGSNSVAIGNQAAPASQGNNAVAIGSSPASVSQGNSSVAIGNLAGKTQVTNCIAIGSNSGNNQGSSAIAIGLNAGVTNQNLDCIAIGSGAGNSQSASSIAIGPLAGVSQVGANAIAIGNIAGQTSQSSNAIAIGSNSGNSGQSSGAVAIGLGAGAVSQGANSIAIGVSAGNTSLQSNSIAIGNQAAASSSSTNSITLNASGVNLPPTNSGFFVSPITSVGVTPAEFLGYDNTTKEIVRTSTFPVTPSVYAEIETSSTVTTKTFSALNTFEGFFSMTPGSVNNVTVFNGTAVLPATFTIQVTGTYFFSGEIAIQKTVGGGSSNYRLQMFVNGIAGGVGSAVSTPNTTEVVTCPISFIGTVTAGTVLELRIAQIAGTTPSTLSLQRVNFSGNILTAVPGVQGPVGPAGGGFNGSVSINSITSLGALGPAALVNGIPCNVGDTKNNSLGLTLTPTILGTIGATTQVFSGFVVGGVYMYSVHIALQATATVAARVVRLAQRFTTGVPNAVSDVLQTANIITISAIQSAALFNNWCFSNNLTGFFIATGATDKIWFSAESQVETVAYGGNAASPLTITITRVA